jgi:RNA polymerase sigma-70 factor (ECF subfamily)
MRERTNDQWLADLRGPNPEEALGDLYGLLVRGLKAGLRASGGGVEANAGDFAQEALIRITGNLDSFRGESRFTTWAARDALVPVGRGLRFADGDRDRRAGASLLTLPSFRHPTRG